MNKLKQKNQLHLILAYTWFDEIENGLKREEYRTYNKYWIKRLCTLTNGTVTGIKEFDTVKFHKGYTAQHIIFKIKRISIDGMKSRTAFFIIELGDKI